VQQLVEKRHGRAKVKVEQAFVDLGEPVLFLVA
jgi:hypothetical protein